VKTSQPSRSRLSRLVRKERGKRCFFVGDSATKYDPRWPPAPTITDGGRPAQGTHTATPAAPHRGFVSSIGQDCKARTAGEACPVHAAHPHAFNPPRGPNQHSTPARYTGPARPVHTGRTRPSDARRTLRRASRPRHAPAAATRARPQRPLCCQPPSLPHPAAPAAASPRRMMAFAIHALFFFLLQWLQEQQKARSPGRQRGESCPGPVFCD